MIRNKQSNSFSALNYNNRVFLLNLWIEWLVYRLFSSLIHRWLTSYNILLWGSFLNGIMIFSNTNRKKYRTVSDFVFSSFKKRDSLKEKSRILLEWMLSGDIICKICKNSELKTFSERDSKSTYNKDWSVDVKNDIEKSSEKKGSLVSAIEFLLMN